MPRPNEKSIEFVMRARKNYWQLVTFGGWASDKKIAKYKAQLMDSA